MTDRRRNGFILLLVVGLVIGVAGRDRRRARRRQVQEDRARPRPEGRGGARLPGPSEPADADGHPGRAPARGRHHAQPRRPARRRGAGDPDLERQPDRRRPAERERHRAGRAGGRHDRAARVLRLGGERAHVERQDRREPAPDPGSGGGRDQPGRHEPGSRQSGRGQHEPVRRGHARVQAAVFVQSEQLAHDAPVLHVRGARERGLRRGGQGERHGTRRRSALPAGGPGRQQGGSDLRAPGRRHRLRRPDPRGTARNRGASGDPAELLQAGPDRRSERPVLRAQGQRRAPRQRHHESSAEHRSEHELARRHVRVQQQGQGRVPERHRGDRAPRRARERPRAATQPALRGRARQPADHGPVHRLQAVPRRDQRRQRS